MFELKISFKKVKSKKVRLATKRLLKNNIHTSGR